MVSLLLMASMSSLCCLKMQSMKVLLRHPLKVTANLSRATLSRSVKSKNQAHISWSRVVLVLTAVCVCARAPNIQKIYWNMYEPHDACTKNTLKQGIHWQLCYWALLELPLSQQPGIALRTHVLSKTRSAAPPVSVCHTQPAYFHTSMLYFFTSLFVWAW